MQKQYSLRYEARNFMYILQGQALQQGRKITYGKSIEEAVDRVDAFTGGKGGRGIRWLAVRDAELPEGLIVNNGDDASKRYRTYIDVPQHTEEWLEDLRAYLKTVFKGIARSVYLPYCIWLVLKCDYLLSNGRADEVRAAADDSEE